MKNFFCSFTLLLVSLSMFASYPICVTPSLAVGNNLHNYFSGGTGFTGVPVETNLATLVIEFNNAAGRSYSSEELRWILLNPAQWSSYGVTRAGYSEAVVPYAMNTSGVLVVLPARQPYQGEEFLLVNGQPFFSVKRGNAIKTTTAEQGVAPAPTPVIVKTQQNEDKQFSSGAGNVNTNTASVGDIIIISPAAQTAPERNTSDERTIVYQTADVQPTGVVRTVNNVQYEQVQNRQGNVFWREVGAVVVGSALYDFGKYLIFGRGCNTGFVNNNNNWNTTRSWNSTNNSTFTRPGNDPF